MSQEGPEPLQVGQKAVGKRGADARNPDLAFKGWRAGV